MRTTLILTAALTLAACSSGESLDNQSGGSAAVEPTPTNLTDDPQNMVVPLDPPGNQALQAPVPTAVRRTVRAAMATPHPSPATAQAQ